MVETLRFNRQDLLEFVVKYMGKLGVPEKEAYIVGDVLVEADCRGVNTHGIIRLHTYYGYRLQKGYMSPNSIIKTVKETENTATLDGGNGCGQVVAFRAMEKCLEKAKTNHVGMVTVRNSNHYGIAAYYAMMALKYNMIGISLTNSQPLVAPTYGRSAVMGTNPIAVAVPAENESPYVLDMATSTVPIGRIKIHDKKGIKIPLGWGVDDNGNVTDDPAKIQSGGPGALMPLGGTDEMRGYKGYNLAVLVDILCGVLSGGNVLTDVGFPHEPKESGVSHFFMAIDIDAFRPKRDFTQHMDYLISILKQSPLANNAEQIYIAGEKEHKQAKENSLHGVPVIAPVVEDLKEAGKKIGVHFELKPINRK